MKIPSPEKFQITRSDFDYDRRIALSGCLCQLFGVLLPQIASDRTLQEFIDAVVNGEARGRVWTINLNGLEVSLTTGSGKLSPSVFKNGQTAVPLIAPHSS